MKCKFPYDLAEARKSKNLELWGTRSEDKHTSIKMCTAPTKLGCSIINKQVEYHFSKGSAGGFDKLFL